MNKKLWEKPEVKVLDIKKDTKVESFSCRPHKSGN